jgi:glycine cleavage system H protein
MESTMETLVTFGESALIFIAGLVIRFAIALAALAVVVLPILGIFVAVRFGKTIRERLHGYVHAGRLLLVRGLYYAPGHTWLKDEGGSALRLGVDDLAQRLLTGARRVRIARPGSALQRGDTLAEITLDGRTARIEAPVAGVVVQTNDKLTVSPELVHRDPYGRGWLAVVVNASAAYRSLRTGDDARRWLEAEDQRLTVFFEQTLGVAAADGGEYLLPPPEMLGQEQWEAVTRAFLSTGAHQR